MSLAGLVAKVKNAFSEEPNFRPYDIRRTVITYGIPPIPLRGIQYVFARHNVQQNKLIMGLSGQGVFVSNQNQSGIIEFGILNGSVACAEIELMELTGIPMPIVLTDLDTDGTSTVLASGCRRTGSPEWRRELLPGIDVYTFETPLLLISDGLRLVE